MSERDNILERVREALGTTRDTVNAGDQAERLARIQSVLPRVGESTEDRVALFRKYSEELKTDFRLCADVDEAGKQLMALADSENWQSVAMHPGELTDQVKSALQVELFPVTEDYDVGRLEKCSAGLTECDALVAQTGSVLVTSRSAGGRALSVLPPHHVVVARREQLVAGLPEAFALIQRKYAPSYPSMISFITGPSRTGDIERILVLGAHGPKKLTILCW